MMAAHAADPLVMLYDPRPPLLDVQDGKLVGEMGVRAQRALAASGLRYQLKPAPVQRQLSMIEHGTVPVCAVGRVHNEERARIGVFSSPFFVSRRYVALVRDGFRKEERAPRLLDWAAAPEARWGVKSGFHYSDYVRRQLRIARAHVLGFSRDNEDFVALLGAGRIDFVLMHEDEAELSLRGLPAPVTDVRIVQLADLAEGEMRYFYCNRHVPPATLQQINQAIARALKP
ncbi:transporter substrate-binding domain-containing protein [Uliginosibacterium sp. H1]|uniref:transporter substrate-binding domain-containing protein n=1 Tax=Uliginosibacterium sp. H1 TaxID=3114757 RepID=UPI002E180272|nr:transporter substrate-binding domain-containing protein [Uliginosibacterium sp. H1]